jgi:hypothetical protein
LKRSALWVFSDADVVDISHVQKGGGGEKDLEKNHVCYKACNLCSNPIQKGE